MIGKGTGLGLSISKGIIEGHQGTVKLAEDGKNTEFIIRLPKVQRSRRC
jgi:signal transduction histidine kinase